MDGKTTQAEAVNVATFLILRRAFDNISLACFGLFR